MQHINDSDSYVTLEPPTHTFILSSICFSMHLLFIIHFCLLPQRCLFLPSLLIIFLTVAFLRCTNNNRARSYRQQAQEHLSLREPLLRRQAWVERPLGSGSRYCTTEGWSILGHCSSTGWRSRKLIVVRMQDILHSSPSATTTVAQPLSKTQGQLYL